MKRKIRYYRLLWLKYDLPAGLSVFLIALPLCLGIALASGAPLYAGIMSGIVGGIVVSLVSGSQLAVSGPAAGLSTVVAGSVASLGGYQTFLLAVIVAGFLQLLLGVFKLGAIANYFPSAVIKGMLAAIGIILISKQIPIAIGYDKPDFWTSGFPDLFNKNNFLGNMQNFNKHIARGALIVTASSLLLLILLQQNIARSLKVIPAPLLVVVTAVLINMIFTRAAAGYSLKPTQLVSIPENIFAGISFPDFGRLFHNAGIWKDGLVLGLLATLETLLCVEAIDKLDVHNRITPVNRELVAQGIGNMCCGIVGAIPITAVVVRGAANVDAGARTKLSSFTHGLFLLLSVLLVPFLLNQIPYASLAAILLVTGFNLTKPKLYRNMWRLGPNQYLPFFITIVSILVTDLLIGVSIGLLLSSYFILRNNFKAEYKITSAVENGVETDVIKLNSNVTFLNKVNLRKILDQIPENSRITIDGSECHFIDYDILEVISEFANKARDRDIELTLKGVRKVDITAVH